MCRRIRSIRTGRAVEDQARARGGAPHEGRIVGAKARIDGMSRALKGQGVERRNLVTTCIILVNVSAFNNQHKDKEKQKEIPKTNK